MLHKANSKSEGRNPHILVVEDQPNTADMLTSYFESQGYEVTAVGWGKDALSFVENNIPDLVVLDIRLPDIDGYEVCRYLRTHRRTKHVPIIFLTEKRQRNDKLEGLELGAADYITKPFVIQELRLRVRNVLSRSKTEPMTNPITKLPTPPLSDEHLRDLLHRPDWAVLSVGLQGLKNFSQTYGFVARDDVVRAVALILNHIIEEEQNANTFVGHLDATNFFIVAAPDKMAKLQQTLQSRLEEAISFFYPYAERGEEGETDAEQPRLDVTMGVLDSSKRSFDNLEELKRAIFDVQGARPR